VTGRYIIHVTRIGLSFAFEKEIYDYDDNINLNNFVPIDLTEDRNTYFDYIWGIAHMTIDPIIQAPSRLEDSFQTYLNTTDF
jgi:hypothetical protein